MSEIDQAAKNAADNAQTKAENFKGQVASTASSISNKAVSNAAANAKNAFTNAGENIAGQVAGQVTGGIQSLTQKTDAFKGQVNDAKDTVEGLLSGDASSLKNMASGMVENAIGGLLSKFGAKVEIEFSEPDENGVVHPITSSLGTDTTSADKIQGVLSIITGLGVDIGNLQNIAAVASPKGLLDAGKNLAAGKIGAFDGADAIKGLVDNAVSSVTSELTSAVGSGLAKARNLGKEVTYVTNFDSTGTTFGTVLSSVGDATAASGRTDSAEFLDSISNLTTSVTSDMNSLIKKSDEIVQSVKGSKDDLENLSGGKNGEDVYNSVQKQTQSRKEYTLRSNEYTTLISSKTKNSQTGLVQSLSIETQTTIRKDIKSFAKGISDEDIEKVIALSLGDAADKSEAIKILAKTSGKDYNKCKEFLASIDATIYNATKPQGDIVVFTEPYEIGSYEKGWKATDPDPIFPYISSVEELQAEMQYMTRKVESVIVHWTETHTNKNIGSEDIHRWHTEAGLDGIGYHYVIRRDGSLQRGRPVNLSGQHTPGLDEGTLSVVFVGGINAPTGTPNSENFISAQSLTRSQLNTFDHFCRSMYNVHPGMKFLGHSEVDVSGLNRDPGFIVSDYVLNRFGKKNDQES